MNDLTRALTSKLWFPFKRRLRAHLPAEEWELWIRPMYLLKAIRANTKQVHLLATIPPNDRIISAVCNRLPLMRKLLAPNFNISLTTYPDEWQISEARRRYGTPFARDNKVSIDLRRATIVCGRRGVQFLWPLPCTPMRVPDWSFSRLRHCFH
jgi:hypothetical protein